MNITRLADQRLPKNFRGNSVNSGPFYGLVSMHVAGWTDEDVPGQFQKGGSDNRLIFDCWQNKLKKEDSKQTEERKKGGSDNRIRFDCSKNQERKDKPNGMDTENKGHDSFKSHQVLW